MKYLVFILIGLAGVWLGSFLARRRHENKASETSQAKLDRVNQAKRVKKEKAKKQIFALLLERGRVTNDMIETLLGVSDATATNYLEELEQEGKIIQHGEVGRGVFYTSRNG